MGSNGLKDHIIPESSLAWVLWLEALLGANHFTVWARCDCCATCTNEVSYGWMSFLILAILKSIQGLFLVAPALEGCHVLSRTKVSLQLQASQMPITSLGALCMLPAQIYLVMSCRNSQMPSYRIVAPLPPSSNYLVRISLSL